MYLSVPIPEEDVCDISDCIKNFTKEEILDGDEKWFCPKCKDFKAAKKKIGLWKMPNILVVHLKRFAYTRTKRGKIKTFVDFKISNFNLTSLVDGKQKESPNYDLFAVCVCFLKKNHEGSLGGGHYTAVCKNRESKLWYHFNDSTIVSPSAYVLFYSKTSVDNFRRQTISRPDAWPHILEARKSSLMTAKTQFYVKKGSKASQFSKNEERK